MQRNEELLLRADNVQTENITGNLGICIRNFNIFCICFGLEILLLEIYSKEIIMYVHEDSVK